MLTNFAHTPFVIPKYGEFQSVEGFWYFCKCGRIFPEFKKLHGFQAKQLGKKLIPNLEGEKDFLTEEFKELILEAIRCKLRQNKTLLKMLIESDLPFYHYYYYERSKRIQKLPSFDWIIEEIERIRKISQEWYYN